MQRAGQKKGIVSRSTTSVTPPVGTSARATVAVEFKERDGSVPSRGPILSCERLDRQSLLSTAIRKRIESRLAGRVRNLAVRVLEDTVVLEGKCATYYTKQLAQHAALGILEDEHLENAIVVDVPQ